MFVFEEPTTEMAKLDLLCFLFFEDFLKAITDISDIELNLFFNWQQKRVDILSVI